MHVLQLHSIAITPGSAVSAAQLLTDEIDPFAWVLVLERRYSLAGGNVMAGPVDLQNRAAYDDSNGELDEVF